MRQQAAVLAVHQALQARGQQTPEELVAVANDVAAKLLSSGRQRQIVQGVNLAREMKLSAVRTQLEAIATGGEYAAVRPAAIDACVACDPAGSVPMLARLADSAPEPIAIRQKAAQALGAINNAAAHRELVALFASAPSIDPSQRLQEPPISGDPPSPVNPPSGCRFHTRCAHAMPRCAETVPPLIPLAADHHVACYLYSP